MNVYIILEKGRKRPYDNQPNAEHDAVIGPFQKIRTIFDSWLFLERDGESHMIPKIDGTVYYRGIFYSDVTMYATAMETADANPFNEADFEIPLKWKQWEYEDKTRNLHIMDAYLFLEALEKGIGDYIYGAHGIEVTGKHKKYIEFSVSQTAYNEAGYHVGSESCTVKFPLIPKNLLGILTNDIHRGRFGELTDFVVIPSLSSPATKFKVSPAGKERGYYPRDDEAWYQTLEGGWDGFKSFMAGTYWSFDTHRGNEKTWEPISP